jgi:hypothetical protein
MKDTPSAGRPADCLPDAFADRRTQDTKKNPDNMAPNFAYILYRHFLQKTT